MKVCRYRCPAINVCKILFSIILLMNLGIVQCAHAENEPLLNSPFGFHPAKVARDGYADSGYADASNIGVGWTREGMYAFWFRVQPDINEPVYNFDVYDNQWGAIPTSLHILGNICPEGPVDEGYCMPNSFLPIDEAKYVAFVKATVERYDGDGVNDMPGLTNPIKYWQVGNEPSVFYKSDFADLQRITYLAIKDACPECTVLLAGPQGYSRRASYTSSFNAHFKPILVDLAGQYVDVMDFHWYGQATGHYRLKDWGGTGQDVVDFIRSTLTDNGFDTNMPIWITEMGSYSGVTTVEPFQTERQQAMDYFKRYIYSLSSGIDKIFIAFGLMEGFEHDDRYFDHTGLIYDGEFDYDQGLGVKKLSYYTYKKMTEQLKDADWSTITKLRDGTESDCLYVFNIEKNNQPIHIAWWDYFDESSYNEGDKKSITLNGLATTKVLVTEVVPWVELGKDVSDYNTAFIVTEYPVSNGSVTLAIGENPVLIVSSGALSGYDAWRLSYSMTGLLALATNDYDLDRWSNLLEYSLDGNPTNPSSVGTGPILGGFKQVNGTNWVEYIHLQRTNANHGLTYTLEQTRALVNQPWSNCVDAVTTGMGPASNSDFMTVTTRIPIDGKNKEFIRLRIEQ